MRITRGLHHKSSLKKSHNYYFGELILLVSLFSFFTPVVFIYQEPFSDYYFLINYGKCFLSIIFIVVVMIRNSWKVDYIFVSSIIFSLLLLLSSVAGEMNFSSWVNTTLTIVGVIALCWYFCHRDLLSFLYVGFWYFFVLILINDIIMIKYPLGFFSIRNELGIQRFYFLAQKNSFSEFIFPALLFSHLCHEKEIIRKSQLVLAIIGCLIPPIMCMSVTTTIGVIAFELMIFIGNKAEIMKAKKTWVIFIVAVCAMQLIFTYIFEIDFVQYIITNYLHKDSTLSGRQRIWTSAHDLISNNLLFGKGNGRNGYYFYTIFGDYAHGSVMWAHNTSLDLLVQGGIALFAAYYGVIVVSLKKIFRQKKLNRESIIILSTFVVYILMGFTERFDFRTDFYIVIAIAALFNCFTSCQPSQQQ